MARVYQGERVALERVLGPVERLTYRAAARRPGAAAGLEGLREHDARVQRPLLRGAVRDPPHAGDPSLQPRGLRLGSVGRVLQHRRVLHQQHELAVLRRRDDALLLLADGGAGGAELRLGRGRHGRARRRDPRLREPRRQGARELLAGRHAHAALHPAAAVPGRRAGARLAGRDPDAQRLRDLLDRAGRRPDARARPGRLADRDQAARHQRRRLLQREQRDAVREPHHVRELRRGALHPAHPRRADRHVRAHGGQPPPGLGALRGDGRAARGDHRRGLRRRAERLAGPEVRRCGAGLRRRHHRRKPRGQGAALRHRQQRAVERPSPPTPRTARSTPPSTPTPASAAASRSRT